MVEHLRGKIKLGHGLPDSPTEGACLCRKENKGFNQYVMKARNPCATSHSQQNLMFLPNSYNCRVGALVAEPVFSPLVVATFDPHGSLAKLEIEDVVTWGGSSNHI
jgi:hypothetical protein